MDPVIKELLDFVEKHHLEQVFPWLAFYILRARQGHLSRIQAGILLRRLRVELAELDRVPYHLLATPTAEELRADGGQDITLGTVRNNAEVPCGLRLLDRPRSVTVCGSVGSGKSTTIRRMIIEIDRLAKKIGRPIPVIVFDRKSSEYSDLPRLLGSNWMHLSAHHGSWLGLNGPAIPNRVWVGVIVTLLSVATGLQFAAAVLAKAITVLLERLNPPGTAIQRWPTLEEARDEIHRWPTKYAEKPAYAQSLQTVLNEILRAAGALLRTHRGIDINEDIIAKGRSVVIDIAGLDSTSLHLFLVWILIAAVLYDRNYRGHRTDTTETVFVIDEADSDVSRTMEARFGSSLSVIGKLLQHGREWGLSAIVGLHSPGLASRELLTNAPVSLVHSLHDAESVHEISKSLMLPPGAGKVLPALPPGTCIARFAQSSYPEPFLVTINGVPPNRTTEQPDYTIPPTDPPTESDVLSAVEMVEPETDLQGSNGSATEVHPASAQSTAPAASEPPFELNNDSRKIVSLIDVHPWMPFGVVLRHLPEKLSGSARMKVREQLERKPALVEFKDVRIETTLVTLVRLTPEGCKYLHREAVGLDVNRSLAHASEQGWIHGVGTKRGLDSRTEFKIPGADSRADNAWKLADGWQTFEVVEGTRSNLGQHVKAALLQSDAVVRVIVVARQKSMLRELQALVEAEPVLHPVLGRIEYHTCLRYLRELYP